MKNDRKEGILIVNTDKPYKVSHDGNYIEKNQIVCREMDYRTEWIGADLYQMVMGAIVTSHINKSDAISQSSNSSNNETDAEKFNSNNSPTIKQVEDMAEGYKMFVMTSSDVHISTFMEKFEGMVSAELIQSDVNKPIGLGDWRTGVNWQDKMKIAFCYISFFAIPSQNVSQTTETEPPEALTK